MRGYSNLVTSHRECRSTDWINAITTGGGVFIEDFLSDVALADISKTIKARASKHLSGARIDRPFGRVFMAIGRPASRGWGGTRSISLICLRILYLARSLMRCCKTVAKEYWLNTCQAMIMAWRACSNPAPRRRQLGQCAIGILAE